MSLLPNQTNLSQFNFYYQIFETKMNFNEIKSLNDELDEVAFENDLK